MYKLDITKSAGKFISKLPPKQYRQLVSTIYVFILIPPHFCAIGYESLVSGEVPMKIVNNQLKTLKIP